MTDDDALRATINAVKVKRYNLVVTGIDHDGGATRVYLQSDNDTSLSRIIDNLRKAGVAVSRAGVSIKAGYQRVYVVLEAAP